MLKLENLSKSYGKKRILEDISLEIEKGEIVSILGPSGCGKTTLLNLVLGLAKASGGRILFDGEDLTNVPMEKRGFNIVFQDYALFPNLNAYENIVYGLRNYPDRSTEEEVKDLIELLGLGKHLEQRIDELSGGQKQRLCIARALLKKPKILILDDSTSAVDTATDAKIRKAFREEIPGTTKIIIAQRISSVQDADRILVLDNGKIDGLGTHEELLKTNAIYQEVYNSQTQGSGDFDKQGGEQ